MQELGRDKQRYLDAIGEMEAARTVLGDGATLISWLDTGDVSEAATDALGGRPVDDKPVLAFRQDARRVAPRLRAPGRASRYPPRQASAGTEASSPTGQAFEACECQTNLREEVSDAPEGSPAEEDADQAAAEQPRSKAGFHPTLPEEVGRP